MMYPWWYKIYILKPKPPIPAFQLSDRWRRPFFSTRFRAERDIMLVEEWKLWKFLIFKLSPSTYSFLSLRFKYFLRYLVPEHQYQTSGMVIILCGLFLIFFFWRQFRKEILSKMVENSSNLICFGLHHDCGQMCWIFYIFEKCMAVLYIIIYCVEVGFFFVNYYYTTSFFVYCLKIE